MSLVWLTTEYTYDQPNLIMPVNLIQITGNIMKPQSKVIFWLTFSLVMMASFFVFPGYPEDELSLVIGQLLARTWLAWVGGKLAVSYYEDE